jgi:hypothetical protein
MAAAGLSVILAHDVAAQTKGSGIGNTSCAQFAELYRDAERAQIFCPITSMQTIKKRICGGSATSGPRRFISTP